MSKVLWKKLLKPDLNTTSSAFVSESYEDQVDNTRAYEIASSEISIVDAKAFRSMSRASLFMAHICEEAREVMKPFLDKSPFSIGVYCATENGPIDAPSTKKIIDQQDPEKFATYYRKFRNPKMYLKQLPNLVPAQTGIFMGLQGPMNVYTHSTAAAYHALEQAEWDLKTGVVQAALVCATHAFDDYMVVKRTRKNDSRCLNEGAAAVLLVADTNFTQWKQLEQLDDQNYFGIADPMIKIFSNI